MRRAESTECFIEDPAFLRSYDSAPPPPLPHPPVVSHHESSCVSPVDLADGRGGGGWPGAKSYDREKAGPSIYISQYSLMYNIYDSCAEKVS